MGKFTPIHVRRALFAYALCAFVAGSIAGCGGSGDDDQNTSLLNTLTISEPSSDLSISGTRIKITGSVGGTAGTIFSIVALEEADPATDRALGISLPAASTGDVAIGSPGVRLELSNTSSAGVMFEATSGTIHVTSLTDASYRLEFRDVVFAPKATSTTPGTGSFTLNGEFEGPQ